MPKQNFTINTKNGYAGDLYGIVLTNTQRNTYIADVDNSIQYGCAVKSSNNRKATAGVNDDGTVNGIVLRTLNNEQAKRPGDGSVFFRKGDAMTVVEQGYVQVDILGATAGADLFVAADGTFTTDSSKGTAVSNVSIYRDADEFGLAVVWVENRLGKEVAA